MPQLDEGTFRCPKCFQMYEVPEPTTLGEIVGHMGKHGMRIDKRWVRRRLFQQAAEAAPTKETSE